MVQFWNFDPGRPGYPGRPGTGIGNLSCPGPGPGPGQVNFFHPGPGPGQIEILDPGPGKLKSSVPVPVPVRHKILSWSIPAKGLKPSYLLSKSTHISIHKPNHRFENPAKVVKNV